MLTLGFHNNATYTKERRVWVIYTTEPTSIHVHLKMFIFPFSAGVVHPVPMPLDAIMKKPRTGYKVVRPPNLPRPTSSSTAMPAAAPTFIGGNPHPYRYPPPHPHQPVAAAQPTPALLVAGQQVYHPSSAPGGLVPPLLHHPQPLPMVSMRLPSLSSGRGCMHAGYLYTIYTMERLYLRTSNIRTHLKSGHSLLSYLHREVYETNSEIRTRYVIPRVSLIRRLQCSMFSLVKSEFTCT